MEVLFGQPEQDVDEAAIDVVNPVRDLAYFGIMHSVIRQMRIITGMRWNELHHVLVLLKHDHIRRRWRDALLFLRIEKFLIREIYPKGLRMPTVVGGELRQWLPKSDGP